MTQQILRIPAKTRTKILHEPIGYFTLLRNTGCGFESRRCFYCNRRMAPLSRSGIGNRNHAIIRCRVCVCREAGCYSNLLRGCRSPKFVTEDGYLTFNPAEPWKFMQVWSSWGIRRNTITLA